MPPKKPPTDQDAGPTTQQDVTETQANTSTDSTSSTSTAPRPTTSSSRGRGRGGRLLSQPKFSGRRSAAARQEAEQAAAEKKRSEQQARDAEKAKPKRFERKDNGERGGSFRGRGRGGYVGASDRSQPDGIASGPFSAGQADRKGLFRSPASGQSGGGGGQASSRGGSGAAGSSGTVSGPFGGGHRPFQAPSHAASSSGARVVKQEPGTGRSSRLDGDGDVSMDIKPIIRNTEDGGYISSDEDETETGAGRINVEDLPYIDLTKDDGDVNNFAPVRITRIAHRERALGINADGATNKAGEVATEANDAAPVGASDKKQGKQRARTSDTATERHRFMSVYDDESDHGDGMHEDATKEPRATTPEPTTEANGMPLEALSSPERNRKIKEKVKKQISGNEPEQPDHQTQEEADEWKRHQRDLEILRSELGIPASAARDSNGDTIMSGTEAETDTTDKRDNKVYLFQFPPVLPDLAPIRVKPDPEDPDASSAVADAVQTGGPSNSADNPVSVSDAPSQSHFPAGHVGKLRIHASGRATLDWGGTSLRLGMGTEASSLQDILVLEMPDNKADVKEGDFAAQQQQPPDERTNGLAMSMGQVKGKFVVTPDWDAIFG